MDLLKYLYKYIRDHFIRKPVRVVEKKQVAFLKSKIFPMESLPFEEGVPWKSQYFFKGPAKNVDQLACHASWLKPGHIPHPPHTHKEEEILIMLSGEADLLLSQDGPAGEEDHLRLKEREFVYYPAGFPHSLQATGPAPADYLMVKWSDTTGKHTPMVPFQHHIIDLSDERFNSSRPYDCKPLFEGPTAYLGKLHCHLTRLDPGAGYEAHADDHDVLIIMMEGEAETLGTRVKPRDIIYYAAGEEHGMHNPGLIPARYIVFSFHRFKDSPVKKLEPKAKGRTKNAKVNFYRPRKVILDASTVCQLKCRTCPNSMGTIKRNIGSGFLTYGHFKHFIDHHPWVSAIGLSNWGEAFLNPDLIKIMQYAFEKSVALDMSCNMNNVTDEVIEGIVKYRLRNLVCSVDGASQETYSIYRVNGNFNQVINNIKKINAFKKNYVSPLPGLTWQFIAFGHNEHEIGLARSMAEDLGMKFKIKLSWDDLYFDIFSPVKNRDLIRAESGLDVADRQEYEEKFNKNYIQQCCHDLWLHPVINFDGRLLGCCINHWQDFGNVFDTGLEACLKGEKIKYAKKMLMGLKKERKDIPCINCKVYETRKKYSSFVNVKELQVVR